MILLIMVPLSFALGILLGKQAYHGGYADGQIDAMNQKQNFHLLEFEDGAREYYHKDDLSNFKQSFKIIK